MASRNSLWPLPLAFAPDFLSSRKLPSGRSCSCGVDMFDAVICCVQPWLRRRRAELAFRHMNSAACVTSGCALQLGCEKHKTMCRRPEQGVPQIPMGCTKDSRGSHRGGKQDHSCDNDVERPRDEEGPPPSNEAGVVLQQAVIQLRHDELDGTAACTGPRCITASGCSCASAPQRQTCRRETNQC